MLKQKINAVFTNYSKSEYGPENLKFIEFDFYPNCIRKIRTIEKHEALKQNIGDYVVGELILEKLTYKLLIC